MTTVYLVNIEELSHDSLHKKMLGKMPNRVLEKSAQFKNEGDKVRNLVGEMLSRYAIRKQTGTFPKDIFLCNPQGKPYLNADIRFNISHSGSYVVAAISPGEIGVDIEKLRKNKMMVAKRFFSEEEIKNIQHSNTPDEQFTTFWSLKEAYLKYIGTGLTQALNTFTVKASGNSRYVVYGDNKLIESVAIHHQVIGGAYHLSVCCPENESGIKTVIVQHEDLVREILLS